MKLIKRYIIILSVILTAFAFDASAAVIDSCERNIEGGYVEIDGSLEYDGDVSVIVQYLQEDAQTGQTSYEIDSVAQYESEQDGRFSLVLHILNLDKRIKINICGSDISETVAAEEFFFPSYSKYLEAVEAFKTYDGIKELFENPQKEEYLTFLNIDTSLFSRLKNKEMIYRLIADKAAGTENIEKDFNDITDLYEVLCEINTIAQSGDTEAISAIIENSRHINLESTNTFDVFNYDSLKDGFENTVYTDLISEEGYSSLESFYEAFDEAVILNANENLLYWSEATSVLKLVKNGVLNEIDFDGYMALGSNKSEVDEAIALKSYENISALIKEYNLAVSDVKSKYTSSNKKTGGSGSGGGANLYVPVTEENVSIIPVNKLPQFSDIESYEWAHEAITTLVEEGIVNGFGDNTFCPDKPVTRSEFIKMLVLGMKLELSASGEIVYDDVSSHDWHYPYVMTSREKNIANGITENLFAPDDNITREEIATMVYRACREYAEQTDAETNFKDFDEVSQWAKEAISAISAAGIVNGYTDGTFRPGNTATRAEAAVIIYRMMQEYNN